MCFILLTVLKLVGWKKVVVGLTQQISEVSHSVVCLNVGGEID